MKLRFNPKDVSACDKITAAEDEGKKSIEDIATDKLDDLEDNFDYAVAGLEKLCRDGMYEDAINIINTLAVALADTIAQISDNFGGEA